MITITASVICDNLTREHAFEVDGALCEEDIALSAIWSSGRAVVEACSKPFRFERLPDDALVTGGVTVRLRRSDR